MAVLIDFEGLLAEHVEGVGQLHVAVDVAHERLGLRVIDAELLIQQYNWWGAYNNGWLNSFLGQEGVVRTTPGTDGTLGYNYIAKDDS